jgi:hypothetical protein
MTEFEPKRRITKNDKKNKKSVYSSKHIRIKEQLSIKRNEDSNRVGGPKNVVGVFKGDK